MTLNLNDIIAANNEMTMFRKGLYVTGLEGLLGGTDAFTVFAPTDLAFTRLDKGLLGNWQKQHYYAYFHAVLSHHIVRGKIHFDGLQDGAVLQTINGQSLHILASGDKVTLNHTHIVRQDVAASNGIIHFVDHVIFNN